MQFDRFLEEIRARGWKPMTHLNTPWSGNPDCALYHLTEPVVCSTVLIEKNKEGEAFYTWFSPWNYDCANGRQATMERCRGCLAKRAEFKRLAGEP